MAKKTPKATSDVPASGDQIRLTANRPRFEVAPGKARPAFAVNFRAGQVYRVTPATVHPASRVVDATTAAALIAEGVAERVQPE